MSKPKICVVGSCNYDMIAYTDRLPKQGETIMGTDFKMGFGGKGANQAVAAAKLGAEVTMVAKLGEDVFGKQTMENFKNLNIVSKYVYFTDKASSGVAPIWVDKQGHNSIIVVSGANDLITVEEVEASRKAIASSKILICQNEVPLEVTKKALQIAREEGVITVFNPAPAPTVELSNDYFELTDIFCPNETEAELLTHRTVKTLEDAVDAGRALIKKGVKKVLMTLGSKGCLFVDAKTHTHIPGLHVKAFDTTGAGDCFIGSFAYFLGAGLSEEEAARRACIVASVSVQKPGTQKSFPFAKELPADLFVF
ncbi:MAG TPA: ribokinase [Lentisphaeria bacterium]|nr:MAG: ribokinase [Lentisphaerae bacterium GWF2_38_69]HBM17185.1 ribokinase [Lentisphaeria bacterium]